jgi:hypothetical protein
MMPEMPPDPTRFAESEPPAAPLSRTSRVQRILFWSLVGGIVIMAAVLFREHRITEQRYSNLSEISPLSAPYVDTESVTFAMADDSTGAISAVQRDVALPQDPVIRARALLDRLFVEYALPQSAHPLPTSAAIDELFLISLPITNPRDAASPTDFTSRDFLYSSPRGRLAIVNLRGTFVQNHPSGIAVENLTLRSIIGTLHANNPDIEQVRFLVDGQPRDTLAGHADLTRTYPCIDTTGTPIQPAIDNTSDPSPDSGSQ